MRRAAALIGAILATLSAAPAALGAVSPDSAIPRFGHVFLIIGENTDYSHIDPTNTDPPLGGGGHTVCAVISPLLKPGESGAVTYVYSLLRTLQDGFGSVAPGYLGAADQVSPLPVSWN